MVLGLLIGTAAALAACGSGDVEAAAPTTTAATAPTPEPDGRLDCVGGKAMAITAAMSFDGPGSPTPFEAAARFASVAFASIPSDPASYRDLGGVLTYDQDGRTVAAISVTEHRPGAFWATGIEVCDESLDVFVPVSLG